MLTKSRVLKTKATGMSSLAATVGAGAYASTPDSAALNVGPDLDLRIYCQEPDWTPAAARTLIVKYGAAGQRSFRWELQTDGTMTLFVSNDGTAVTQPVSTVATGVTDGAAKWLRVTFDADNGAAGKTTTFYTSDDGSSWTQLGATVTSATAFTVIWDSTAPLEVGARSAATLNVGTIFYAEVRSSIGGTVVASPNFAAQRQFHRQFFDAQANPWTVVGNPGVL